MLTHDDLRGLSPTEAIERAAQYAGVPAEVIDSMWSQESSRGKNLTGPETGQGRARGHFQVMPREHGVLNKRGGREYNPDVFEDSLIMMSEQMRENMAHFGNVSDAVSAYHGGWNKKNWGPITQQYTRTAMGAEPVEPHKGTQVITSPLGNTDSLALQSFAARSGFPLGEEASTGTGGIPMQPPAIGTFEIGQDTLSSSGVAASESRLASQAKAREEQKFWGLYDRDTTLGAAYSDTMRPLFNVISAMGQEEDPEFIRQMSADPTSIIENIGDYNEDERDSLLGSVSTQDYARRLTNIQTRRDDMATMAKASGLSAISAQFLAGAMDPLTYATGWGAAAGFAKAGIGASRLASAGSKGAAQLSFLGENVAGNLAYTGALQALGEYQGPGDYALSAVMSFLPAAIGARGISKQAYMGMLRREQGALAERQGAFLERAYKELGTDADPQDVTRLARRYEEEAAVKEYVQRLSPPPAEGRMHVPDLSDLDAPATQRLLGADSGTTPSGTRAPDARPTSDMRTVLQEVARDTNTPEGKAAEYILSRAKGDLLDKTPVTQGDVSRTMGNRVEIDRNGARMDPVHEAVHVLTQDAIEAVSKGMEVSVSTRRAVDRLQRQFDRLKKDWLKTQGEGYVLDPNRSSLDYSFQNLHEFVTGAITDKEFQQFLAGQKTRSKGGFGKATSQLREFYKSLLDLLGIQAKGSELDRAIGHIDTLLARKPENRVPVVGTPELRAPRGPGTHGPGAENVQGVQPSEVGRHVEFTDAEMEAMHRYGIDTLPEGSALERAEKKIIAGLYVTAENFMKENPIDSAKLKTMLHNGMVDLDTPGLRLARSDNPVAQMVASLITETTTGAAGRNVTASIRANQYQRHIVGDGILGYDREYRAWRSNKYGAMKGRLEDAISQDPRREFNRAVAEAIEGRRWDMQTTQDANILRAADALEASYTRALELQKSRKTPGWARLPENSLGYMSHMIDKRAFLKLTPQQQRAMRDVFAEQLMELNDMDRQFAEKVAGAYMDHARVNANAGNEIPASFTDPFAVDYVREAMQAAGMSEAQVRAVGNKLGRGAPGHTKQRLVLNLNKTYRDADGGTFSLLDLFDTDHTAMLRNQARRVAGEAALMEQGIAGSGGLQLVERALQFGGHGDTRNHKQMMEAFQQISAEILGRPYGDKMPTIMEGVTTLNSLARMGMVGINQIGEFTQFATSLGVQSMFEGIGGFPRMIREVRAIARGEKVENSLLGSMEQYGGTGQFGLDDYQMVTYFDSPSAPYEVVGQDRMNFAQRALGRASHGLGSLSLDRITRAAQTRLAAEQITMKAWRYIRDGKESKALADMGFSPDLQKRLKAELDNGVVTWDEHGRLSSFDVRKAKDITAMGEFSTAVTRGTRQIIQGAFVGETAKWQHGWFGRTLAQFRSYPMLAVEKAWGRNRHMHGAAKTMAMLMGAASVIVPLHMARVAFNAIGRDDVEEYIERNTSWAALGRATLNYVTLAGMAGDVVDVLSGAPFIPDTVKDTLGDGGLYTRPASLTNIIPSLGYVLDVEKGTVGGDYSKLPKVLPFSNTPFFAPVANLMSSYTKGLQD